VAPVVAWRFTLSHPLLHHRYAEAIEIFIDLAFSDQVFFLDSFKEKNQFCNNLFLFHHMCLKIMSYKLESTKVESPVALAVLC